MSALDKLLEDFDADATIQRIIASEQLTRQDHLQLSSCLLSDQAMTDDRRRQINRILDYVQLKRYQIIAD